MALTIAGSSLTSRLTARLSTRRTTTAQADGDDAAVAWESLQVVSGLRAELVKRDVCREQLIDGVRHTVGLPEREDQELRATNVADHGHDLDRLAIGVLLVPFAEEQSAREPAGCAMIQLEQRDG